MAPGVRACAAHFGFDFLAFYTAGSFVADGRPADLYDLNAVHEFERDAATAAGLQLGDATGPWWNPPFYAWAFAPLSRLPFGAALGVWTLINVAAAVAAGALLAGMLRSAVTAADLPSDIPSFPASRERAGGRVYSASNGHHHPNGTAPSPRPSPGVPGEGAGRHAAAPSSAANWRTWGLVPLLLVTSCPFYLAMTHGQNSGTSLLIVTLAAAAWRRRRAFAAGAVVALLAYKPQLAAVLGVVLILDLGRRAFVGGGVVGGALLLINAVTLPGTLADYLRRLPANVHLLQTQLPYLWERHVTLKAFWRLLLQGRDAGETAGPVTVLTVASAIAVLALVAVTVARLRRVEEAHAGAARDQLIAVTLLATPLLMPFYFDYDLLLLAVPATLYAANRMKESTNRWAVAMWAGLALSLFVNPYVATAARLNVSTLLLTALAMRTGWQNWTPARTEAQPDETAEPQFRRTAA